MKKAQHLATRLSTHLDDEYTALIGGDIARIEVMAEEKLAVLEEISALPIQDIRSFEHLRDRLIRNQILTHSALKGMREAIARAKEIQIVAAGLRTYSAKGSSEDVRVTLGTALSKRS